MPELTKRLVGLMSDRIREATRLEQQRDRQYEYPRTVPGAAVQRGSAARIPVYGSEWFLLGDTEIRRDLLCDDGTARHQYSDQWPDRTTEFRHCGCGGWAEPGHR